MIPPPIDAPDTDCLGIPRSRVLATALGALGLGSALAAGLARAGSPTMGAGDRAVLRFALTLEQLQTAFYDHALATGRLSGEVRQFAEIVRDEERAHLLYVQRALGQGAGAPQFRFGDAAQDDGRFVAAAATLEETGLAAYNGQAGNLTPGALAAVSRVISVEARHTAWVRSLTGELPAPDPIDEPISAAQAMSRVRPFIAS